jgi:hypothetical protein
LAGENSLMYDPVTQARISRSCGILFGTVNSLKVFNQKSLGRTYFISTRYVEIFYDFGGRMLNIKVIDCSKNCLVWLLFDCIACRKCYILLFVLWNSVEYFKCDIKDFISQIMRLNTVQWTSSRIQGPNKYVNLFMTPDGKGKWQIKSEPSKLHGLHILSHAKFRRGLGKYPLKLASETKECKIITPKP